MLAANRPPDDAPRARGVIRKNDRDDRKVQALRRSEFNWKTANCVLDKLAEGKNLTRITKERGMPSYQKLNTWIKNNDEFAELFRAARDVYYQIMADDMIDIVDNPDKTGKSRAGTKEKIWRDRLRAEQRQWTLARVLPKLYGTRPIDPAGAAQLSSDLLAVIKMVTEIASGRRTHEGGVVEAEFTEVTDAVRDAPWKPGKKNLLEEGEKLPESTAPDIKSS